MWLKDWPTEPGHWWFYGYESLQSQRKNLLLVHVRKGNGCMIYISGSRFLFKEEAIDAKWQKAELPLLPTEE